jgi:hypothetical protein
MKKGLMFFLICFCPLFYWLYGIQQVKHEVAVRLVLVDVIATKDGEFVKDLTVEDFEVKEDGKKIPINSFELISFEERELSIQEPKVLNPMQIQPMPCANLH